MIETFSWLKIMTIAGQITDTKKDTILFLPSNLTNGISVCDIVVHSLIVCYFATLVTEYARNVTLA